MKKGLKDIKSFLNNLLRIATLFTDHKKQLIVALCFAVTATFFGVLGPRFISKAINILFYGASNQNINFYDLLLTLFEVALIYIVSAGCQLVQGIVGTNISRKICYDLRQKLISKIQRLPISYFENTSKGDTLSRIINDVDQLGQSIAEVFVNTVTAGCMLLGSLIMMFSINVILALIILVLVPLSLILVALIVRFSQSLFVAQQNQLGKVNGYVEEMFAGQELVQSYNREDDTIEEFNKRNNKLYKVGLKARVISLLSGPIMQILNNISYIAVVIIGAYMSILGTFTVGDIQAFIMYVNNFTSPLQTLMGIFNTVQQMAASCERIYTFLGEKEDVDIKKLPAANDNNLSNALKVDLKYNSRENSPIISFEHVYFGYKKDKTIINDFNLDIYPGQTVAIVGPTGAGKSTLVKLLMRFYDVNSGAIKMRGADTRTMKKANVRENFGIVLQDIWLFRGTIAQNIRYGDLDASDQKMLRAAHAGCADTFIDALPNTYNTILSEGAKNVSQGERQLLSISRAVIAERDIMILDEATSSVDTMTEKKVYKAFDNVIENKTCFVIAHRLSTIRNADVILVLNNGDVIEQGSHDQLLEQKGFYYDLFMSGR